jgi:hypothetical protein
MTWPVAIAIFTGIFAVLMVDWIAIWERMPLVLRGGVIVALLLVGAMNGERIARAIRWLAHLV